MSTTIVSVSTIVYLLRELFEHWHANFDNPLLQTGQLKGSEATNEFVVEICVTGDLSLNYEQKIFPEIELTINRQCWIKDDYDNFLAVDVLRGNCHWLTDNLYDLPAMDLALDVTNDIRLALSLVPLKKLKEDSRFLFN